MCVPSFNLLGLTVSEKSVTKTNVWQLDKEKWRNKGTNKQEQPDSGIHNTSFRCPRVYQVSTLFLKKVWRKLFKKKSLHTNIHVFTKKTKTIYLLYTSYTRVGGWRGKGGIKKSSAAVYHSILFTGIKANWGSVALVLLVKCNTLILYAYFLQMFMLLLVSVTFLPMHKKKSIAISSFLQQFLTFVKILLKSRRKITAGICL